MPIVRQASFAGGEIDPLLYGRTDHPKYPSAVRTLLNFIVGQQGAAKNRAGTKYLASVKTPTISPRLVPFLWPSQNYVLEFGNLYVRFFSNGGVVGAPYEVATPFTTAMLPYLKFAQSGDTLTVCYGGQGADAAVAPQELKRIAHTNWTIAAINFVPTATGGWIGPTLTGGGQQADATHYGRQWWWVVTLMLKEVATGRVFESAIYDLGLLGLPGWNSFITYGVGAIVSDLTHVYTSMQAGNLNKIPGAQPTWWNPGIVIYPDKTVNLQLGGYSNASFLLLGYNIYRVQGGAAGYLDFVDASATDYADSGKAADFSIQPPQSTDPFALKNQFGAVTGHDYPSCVTYFQQRRIFARQALHLARLAGSRTGQPSNFDVDLVVSDSDALNFDLASQQIEEVRSLISLRALMAMTSTGVTVIRGSGSLRAGGVALSPASIDASRQSSRGSSWVDPVVVDNTVVFAQAKGSAVRAITYNPYWEILEPPGTDLATIAQHFLRSHTVVGMAWQEAPDSIIWIVRDDGVLLGLTFVPSAQPDQQIYAWHQHTTDGAVEQVCCVPEGTEDALYLVVRRTVNGGTVRYVERMASRILPLITVPDPKDATKTITRDDARFGVFLDAALSFDGRNTGATTMTFTADAGTYAGGEQGTIAASVASFVITDIGDVVMFDPDGAKGGPFRLTVIDYTDTQHVRVQLDAPLPAAFQGIASASWAWARRTMSNLGHLEAKALAVLADGSVQGPFTVVGGAITLSTPGAVVVAGLPYVSDLELLDIPANAVKPNVKAVTRAFIEVAASRGLYAGQDATRLRAWKQREVRDSFGAVPVQTGMVEVGIDGTWNRGGRVLLRQVDPLPLTVDAVVREVEVGGP